MMFGKHSQKRLDYLRKKVQSDNAKSTAETPQQENAPNLPARVLSPPHEALPPTKFSTVFRQRMKDDSRKRQASAQSKTLSTPVANEPQFSLSTPATQTVEKEVVFSEPSPLTIDAGDLNTSAWAMMGDSDDFDWKTTNYTEQHVMELLDSSLISLNESHEAAALPPKTPLRPSAGGSTTQVCYDKWKRGSPNRLVGSSKAKQKETKPVDVPGKGSPFNTFRQNSTGIALDETSFYVSRIKELESALKKEKQQREALEATAKNSFHTPYPSRGKMAQTPGSTTTSDRDSDSMYNRNQTLVKEVRFAEQTCIELSGQKTALEKQATDLQMQVESLRVENQSLQSRVAQVEKEKSTAESLETSWKSRVTELENLLTVTECEKSQVVKQCLRWEDRFKEVERKACVDLDAEDERQGKLMQAILDKEKLSKDLEDALAKFALAEKTIASLEQDQHDQASRFETEKERLIQAQRDGQADMQAKLDHLDGEKERLTQENKLLGSAREQELEQIRRLKTEKQQIVEERNEREARTESLLWEARETNESLRKEINELQNHQEKIAEESSTALKSELQHRSSRIFELESLLEEVREENNSLRQGTTALQNRQKEISENVSKSTKTELHLQANKIVELEENLKEANSALQRKKADVETTSKQLLEARSRMQEYDEKLQQERAKNASEVSGLSSELEFFRQKVKDLEKQLDELQTDRECVSLQLSVVSRNLKENAKEHEAERESILREKHELESKCQFLEGKIHCAETETTNLRNCYEDELIKLKDATKLKEDEMEDLSSQLIATESKLAMAVEERSRLLDFKAHATEALQKYPAQMESFCFNLEQLVNGSTHRLGDRIDSLAQIASHLRGMLVFEHDLEDHNVYESLVDLPSGSQHSLSFSYNDGMTTSKSQKSLPSQIENWQQLGSTMAVSPVHALSERTQESPDYSPQAIRACPSTPESPRDNSDWNATFSPNSNRTVDIEWMEEARGEEKKTNDSLNDTSVGQSEERNNDVVTRDSDSLSSIADLSHLFPEEGSNRHVEKVESSLGGPEKTSQNEKSPSTSQDTEPLQKQLAYLLDQRKSLTASLKNVQLERDLLKQSLKRAPDRAEFEKMEARLQEAHSKQSSLEEEVEDLQRRLDAQEHHFEESLQTTAHEYDVERKELQEQNEMLRSNMEVEIERLQAKCNGKAEKLDSALKEVERLAEFEREVDTESHGVGSTHEKLSQSADELGAEYAHMSEQYENTLAEVERLDDLLSQTEAEKGNLLQELEKVRQGAEARENELTWELGCAKKEVDAKTAELDELTNFIRLQKEETQTAHESQKMASSELAALKITAEKHYLDLESTRSRCKSLQEQDDEKNRLLQEAESRHRKSVEECSRTKDELHRIKSEHLELVQTIRDLQTSKEKTSALIDENDRLADRLATVDKEKKQLESDLQSAQGQISSLERYVSDLRSQKKDLSEALQETGQSMRDIEKEAEATRLRLAEMHAECASLRSHDRSQRQQYVEVEADLKSKLETEQQRQERDTATISGLEAENRKLSNQIHEIELEKQALFNDLEKRGDTISSLNWRLDELLGTVSRLEIDKMSLQEKLTGAQHENNKLKTSFLECNEKIAVLSSDLESAQEAMESSERDRKAAEDLARNAETRLMELQRNQTVFVTDFENIKKENDEKHERIVSLERDLSQSVKEVTDLGEAIEKYRADASAAIAKLDDLSSVRESLESEKARLLSECESNRFALDLAEKSMAENEQEFESIKSKLSHLNQEHDEKDETIENLKKAIEDADALNRDTEDRYLKSVNTLSTVETERESLQKEVETLHGLLSDTEHQLSSLSEKVDTAQAEKQKADDLIDSLSEQLASARVETDELQLRLSRARNEIGALMANRDSLKADVVELQETRSKLDSLTRECRERQNEISDYRERLAEAEGRAQTLTKNQSDLHEELKQVLSEKESAVKEQGDLQRQLHQSQVLVESADQVKAELASVKVKLEESQHALAATRDVQRMLDDANDDIAERDDAIATLQQELAESQGHGSDLATKLSQMHICLVERDEEVAHQKETISGLKKKCKGLREYVRKVASKVDQWEVYYEKQNGVVEGLKLKTTRIARALQEQLQGGWQRDGHGSMLGKELDVLVRELASVCIPSQG